MSCVFYRTQPKVRVRLSPGDGRVAPPSVGRSVTWRSGFSRSYVSPSSPSAHSLYHGFLAFIPSTPSGGVTAEKEGKTRSVDPIANQWRFGEATRSQRVFLVPLSSLVT